MLRRTVRSLWLVCAPWSIADAGETALHGVAGTHVHMAAPDGFLPATLFPAAEV